MFVFLDVELIPPIEELELPGLDEGPQAIHEGQFVRTPVRAGIVKGWQWGNALSPNGTEGQKGRIGGRHGPMSLFLFGLGIVVVVVAGIARRGKSAKGFFRRPIQFQDLPGAREKNGVGPLVAQCGRIKQDGRVVPLGVGQQLVEFGGKPMQLAQIQGTKVQKEIPVDEFVINVETDHGELLIGIGGVQKGIPDENLVVLQGVFEGAIIKSILMETKPRNTNRKRESKKERKTEKTEMYKMGSDKRRNEESLPWVGSFLSLRLERTRLKVHTQDSRPTRTNRGRSV